jgi:hypothetical protein
MEVINDEDGEYDRVEAGISKVQSAPLWVVAFKNTAGCGLLD